MNNEAKHQQKNQNGKKTFWIVLLIIFILIAVASAVLFFMDFIPFPFKEPATEVPEIPTSSEPQVQKVENPVNFDELSAKYPDIVGWIKIPDSVVDYPVMQSAPDEPEDLYFDRDPEKNYRRAGSIYMQKINSSDFANPNTVLYGHNMANGTMFKSIRSYKNINYFKAHPYIYIYMPGHILTYEVYSAFVYDDRHILNSFNFYDRASYGEYLDMTKNPHSMTRQVVLNREITTDDRILTLCTCTSVEGQRFIVEGVLINDQLTY